MTVIKRNGNSVPMDLNKILNSLTWAVNGVDGVNTSEILNTAKLQFSDGMTTSSINKALIRTTNDMSTVYKLGYDKVSSRLLMQEIYHEAYKSIVQPTIEATLKANADLYCYNVLIDSYSEEEFYLYNSMLKEYEYLNFEFSKAGLQNIYDKYMLKRNGIVIEDPIMMFMLITLDACRTITKGRDWFVRKTFEYLATGTITLPTPAMQSFRTNRNTIASCCTIECGDNRHSWHEAIKALMLHTMANAGVGFDASMVASINDPIRGGEILHSGKIPLYKAADAIVGTSSQMGRRGSILAHTFFCDPEILTILQLKSPKTDTAKRINDLKHSIKLNGYLIERVQEGKPIYLFSPRLHKELYEVFHDNFIFKKKYERLVELKKYSGKLDSRELMQELLFIQRPETGIYSILFMDNLNGSRTNHKKVMTMSNICQEAVMPTNPLDPNKPNSPDIGICVLTNSNQAKVNESNVADVTKVIVTLLNHNIKLQKQPTSQGQAYVEQYNSLGIGFSNHAYWLAKQGLKYGSVEALQKTEDWVEMYQYYLIRNSMEYAKEYNACIPRFNETKWSDGTSRFFHQNKKSRWNWSQLRKDVMKYGIANADISMIPPSATSSIGSNQTESIQGIVNIETIKDSKTGMLKQYAPEAKELLYKYDYAYDTPDYTNRFMKHVAVIQKWTCQGISASTSYSPYLFENGKIPAKIIWRDLVEAHKDGVKSFYYNNTQVECEGCSV